MEDARKAKSDAKAAEAKKQKQKVKQLADLERRLGNGDPTTPQPSSSKVARKRDKALPAAEPASDQDIRITEGDACDASDQEYVPNGRASEADDDSPSNVNNGASEELAKKKGKKTKGKMSLRDQVRMLADDSSDEEKGAGHEVALTGNKARDKGN